MTDLFSIDFEPIGRRGSAAPGQTILEAARSAGVGLASVCGGAGTCEECRVRIAAGKVTPPTLVEQSALEGSSLKAGIRLACQVKPLSDLKVDIPPESLTTPQRLQLEGQESDLLPNPAVTTSGAYGLAVDIGTTKLAAYLVNLARGKTVARAGAMNPQVAYGEDVISRIAFIGREPGGDKKLQSLLMESINTLLAEMCAASGIQPAAVMDAVLVGNTAMHHIAAGLPVEQLGRAPFAPATTQPLSLPAKTLGLDLAAGSCVYFPPVIAGYVGADHLAMLLSTNAWKSKSNVMAVDIGTNTEISLITGGKISSCSCASGPAFEGAHIHEGMRAAPGAIERARWSGGQILWQTIDAQPPVGLCGSGILDVVAALQDGRMVKPNGALLNNAPTGLVLVPANQSGLGRNLMVTRKDIHEVQLAKSAIRAGLESLLRRAGMDAASIDEFIVAGAFGTYLDVGSAIRVGMFPSLPLERFHQVGNAAGIGAKQMLVSVDKRREAEQLAGMIDYVELTTQPDFTNLFMKHLALEV